MQVSFSQANRAKYSESGRSIPVNAALPQGIIKTIEEVEEHRSDEARSSPIPALPVASIVGRYHIRPGITLLPCVSTTPDGHSNNEEADERRLGTNGATEIFEIKERAQDHGTDNLRKPVQEPIQGLGASVEISCINGVLLVCIEPIRREEHGEKENNIGVEFDGIPKADQLRFPGRVLLHDNPGSITADNFGSVAKHEGKHSTKCHKNNEGNIGTIFHIHIFHDVDVGAESNLDCRSLVKHLNEGTRIRPIRTKLPTQAPTLKIPQNQAK